MNPRRANLITAAGLIALMVGVAWSAPRWSRLLTRSLPGTGADEEESTPAPRPSAEEAARTIERQITVKLFFPSAERPGLTIEERPVAFSNDLSRQLRAVVEELVLGPKAGALPPFLPATKVLDVFFSPRGTAYVDLSKEAGEGHAGGSATELIAVYSVVNSLVANFPAVKRVQILLEDKPVATLAGHVDLTRPLTADMTFLADLTGTPTQGPSSGPGGAP